MWKILASTALASAFVVSPTLFAAEKSSEKPSAALGFKVQSLDGKDVDLGQYKGKVVLIVNVASKCGLTPQYAKLEELYKKYDDQGFVILGFPCNQFHSQEPGTADEIRKFCTSKYNVTFPLMAKVEVNGDGACDLYKYLKALHLKPKGPGEVTWNFEKFLVGRDGKVVARFKPQTKPDAAEVVKAIETELDKK
jgi:glutathione peroxidase